MTNLVRRLVTVSVLSALVLSSAPAHASLKPGKRLVPARVHPAKLPVHHALSTHSIPSTPKNFASAAGDRQAMFSWSEVAIATRYVVMLQPNNASCVTSTTTCAVQGLVNGTSYSATVVAVNSAGRSAASTARTVTPVASPPKAPRAVSAIAFGLHARVTWLPVTGLSSPVTSYTATSTPGALTCTSATTTCVISELAAGTSYTFTVTAANAVGTSPDSSPSASITILDRPDSPTNVTLAPSPDSIGVSWDAPASDGGSAIDSYKATAYLASSGAPVAHCRISGATSCEITGLSTATSYVVRVVAHNTVGYSIASGTAGPVLTGYNPPGQPLSVNVVGAPESLTIAWLAPSSDGGSAITGYTATADDGDGGIFTCTTSELTCTISGLTNGVTYAVTIVATNGAGDSVVSESTPGTPGTPSSVPDAPTDLVVKPGNGGATVTWTAPNFDGGSAVTNYTVTADDGNGGISTCTTAELSCTVHGLTNGTTYTFSVRAANLTGDSLSSASVQGAPMTNPSVPLQLTISAKAGALVVGWSTPLTDGGATISSYTVWLNGKTMCVTSTLSCAFAALTDASEYQVVVTAANTAGDSPNSTTISLGPINVVYALASASYGSGVIAGVLRTVYAASATDAATTLRVAIGVDYNDAVNWLTLGGYTLAETVTAIHYSYGAPIHGTFYAVRNWFVWSDLTMVPILYAGGYTTTEIAWLLHYFVGDSATATASALQQGLSLSDAATAAALDAGGFWRGYTAQALHDVYGDSAQATAIVFQTVLGYNQNDVLQTLNYAGVYTPGEMTAVLHTYYAASATDAATTLRVAIGVDYNDAVNWLTLGGYTLAETVTAIHYSYGAPIHGTFYAVRNWFVWSDLTMVPILYAGGYTTTEIAWLLHYFVGDSATATASALQQGLSLSDATTAAALDAGGFWRGYTAQALHDVYGDSAQATAIVFQTVLGYNQNDVLQTLNYAGVYTPGEMTAVLHTYYAASATDAATTLRVAIGVDYNDAVNWLTLGGYTLAETVTAIHYSYGAPIHGTFYAVRNWFVWSDLTMVPILYAGGYTTTEIAWLLHYFVGDSATATASALQQGLSLSDATTAAALDAGGFWRGYTAQALHDVYGDSAQATAIVFQTVLGYNQNDVLQTLNYAGVYTPGEMTAVLHTYYAASATDAATTLRVAIGVDYNDAVNWLTLGGYTLAETVTAIHYSYGAPIHGTFYAVRNWFVWSDLTMVPILYAGGYTTTEIAWLLHYFVGDSATATASALQQGLSLSEADMAAVLMAVDYPSGDIATVLRVNYQDSPATALSLVLSIYGIGVGDALNVLRNGGYSFSAPDAPTSVTTTPGTGYSTITWSAPLSNGGFAVTGYTVTANDGNGGVLTCSATTALSCTIEGLTDGLTYAITVVATNVVGNSAASFAVSSLATL